MQSHHHHPRNPEEDDVEAGDERTGRIEALQLRCLVGPAQGRERPQRGRKPRVEHILVAPDVFAREARALLRTGANIAASLSRELSDLDAMGKCVCDRIIFRLGNEYFAIRSIPGRYLMSPPDLP